MGYRIVYGKDPVMRVRGRLRLRMMTAACMLIFAALVRLAWPGGREVLQEVLLPRAEITTAFSEMVSHVRSGGELGESVTAFCRRVASNEIPG